MSTLMKNEGNWILIAFLSASLLFGPVWAQDEQHPVNTPPAGAARAAPQTGTNAKQETDDNKQTGPIRTTSDVVRMDVEVTDKSGKPIKGLKGDQFTITDDGKPQKISIFYYSDIEKVETAGEVNQTPVVIPVDTPVRAAAPAEAMGDQTRDRRMMVLFFDLTSMQTDDIQRAHDAAEKFVKQQMSPADLVAIVTFGARISVLVNFTNDRAALRKGIAQLVPGALSSLGDPLYAAAQNGEAGVQEYTGAAYTADETEFNVFNTDQKLAAVEGLANVLEAIPGRKAVIEFTGGITQTGEENRTALRAATDAANRADVSIYSIDARGLFAAPPGGDVTTNAATGTSMFLGASVFHQTDQREDTRDTLATLSSDTGGKAFFDLGDLSDAFPKIQQDNAGYYLLGYYLPAGIKRDGRWRSVHVKVNTPGAHVRYRAGYYAPRDFQHMEKVSRDEQLAEAMRSDSPAVDLPIAVETAMFRLSDQQTYVPIAAKLSSSVLDWAEKHGRREAAFDFAAEVRAYPAGQSVAELRDTIQVHLDTQRFQQVSQSSLVYQGGVVLAPGKYRLKFLARENESGRIGTFEQDILVPQTNPNHLQLSSVLLSSQLVPLEQTPEVQTKGQGVRANLAHSPLDVGGERIVPSVTRFFTQGQTLYVFFQAYFPEKIEKSEKFDPAGLRAGLIFFRSGLQVNATPLLAPAEVEAKTRTASFRISLPLAKLPAGHFTVQAVVIGAGTQHSAFGRAHFALQQPAPPPQAAPVKPTGSDSTGSATETKPPSH
jgi:VWFA-related protein